MHPIVKQKYQEAKFDYFENANDRNEEAFFIKVKIAKKPVIHKIIKVVRLKDKGKEHVYYHETLKSKDYLNNNIDHSRVIGKYDDPQFLTSVDPQTNQPRQTELQGNEIVYEFPWTPNIIEQWLSQENFELDEDCGYIVIDGGRKYGGYSQEQFCSESFDNLVTLGKFGTLEPNMIEQVRKKQLASK